LLVTKLYFPQPRANLVPRPRLVQRLQRGLRGPLTLIAAPAGYGKTTLLSEWRAGEAKHTPVAWLSLDAGDDAPLHFLLYLTAALNLLQANLAKNTHLLLQSPELPPVEVIGATLLNELSACNHELVIVLDDYHAISAAQVHSLLAFLLDHLPPHVHLVILTRADPSLPLGRLRGRGQLTELRAADLRFTNQEAALFLREIMGLELSEQEIAALETRTEGWIAGLQLAALSMQGRDDHEHFISAFSGSHQYIVDYLAEEVLNRQPEIVRQFLLKTSILERLTGSLCDTLTGRTDGQALLEMLARSNLFLIPLDDERRWYRYHHLFADLLRNRLRLAHPESVAGLHRCAAAWYQQQDLTGEAIPHALAAQDYQFVIDVITKHWLRLARRYRLTEMMQWIESVPSDIYNAHPRLCAIHAYGIWSLGMRDKSAGYLDAAQRLLEAQADRGQIRRDDPQYTVLQAEIKAFRSLSAAHAGEVETALDLARQTLDSAPDPASISRAVASTSLYVAQRKMLEMEHAIRSCREVIECARIADHRVMAVDASYNLGFMLVMQGRLRQAKEAILEAQRYVERLGEGYLPPYGVLSVGLAEIHHLQHELEQALQIITQGVQFNERSGRLSGYLHSRLVEAKIRFSMQEMTTARQIVEEVRQTMQNSSARLYEWDEAGYWRARVMACQGETSPALEWVVKARQAAPAHLRFPHSALALRIAHVLAAASMPQQALQELLALKPVLERSRLAGWLLEACAVEAVCQAKLGQMPAALDALRQALALAEPEGCSQTILDEGEPMRELLLAARRQGIQAEFTDRLLVCFAASSAGKGAAPASTRESLPAPLSRREIELLGLIAAGRSNKEIAEKLFISIGTVKRHTVNIFNKLDAKNRTEAVAKARESGLL
jgi:LuxR family maltose regulon positive regulatory protein